MSRTPPRRPSRRRVLGTLSTAGLGTVVGCAAPSDRNNSGKSTGTNESGKGGPDIVPPGELDVSGERRLVDDPNWRMLGHDTGNTFTNPHAAGPSDDPSVVWTIEDSTLGLMDGYRYHHPLIVDGTVYTTVEDEATADDPERERRNLVAVDADTGEAESLLEVDGRIWRPAIVDGTLYAAVNREVRAYDLRSGGERWRSEPHLFRPSAVRPAGDVVLATDNAVLSYEDGESVPQQYAFDSDTGELLWTGDASADVGTAPLPPIIADGTTVFPHANSLRSLDPGERLAELPVAPRYPVLADGELYGIVDENDAAVLVSYDWLTMAERWTYEPDERISRGWTVAFDNVVVANGNPHGMIGLDRATGERRWRTEPWDEHLGSMYRVATNDTVYVVHDGGAATALDPTDGEIRWQIKTDEMNWGPVSGCALADDLLVTVGDDGTLYAIS